MLLSCRLKGIHKSDVSWPPEKNLKMVICYCLNFRGIELILFLGFICDNMLIRGVASPCLL